MHELLDTLSWPFFDDDNRRARARPPRRWIDAGACPAIDDTADERDTVPRRWSRALRTMAAWLRHAVATDGPLDVRSLCSNPRGACPSSRPRRLRVRNAGARERAHRVCSEAPTLQKLAYLQEPTAERRARIAAFALSEPDAGSDVGAVIDHARRVRRRHDGCSNGTKTWISNGALADYYVVSSRAPRTRRRRPAPVA